MICRCGSMIKTLSWTHLLLTGLSVLKIAPQALVECAQVQLW